MSHPVRVIDVQATEEQFKDMLSGAFEDRPQEVDGRGIRLGGAGRAVHITLHEQPHRELGALDLPMEQVRFEFPDQSEEDADAFMDTYRERTMRTGGG